MRRRALVLALAAASAAPAQAAPAGRTDPVQVLVKLRHGKAHAQTLGALRAVPARRLPAGWQAVTLPPGTAVADALAALRRDPAVAEAAPNRTYRQMGVPDDTYFDLQWSLHNLGQSVLDAPSTPNADIDGTEAWDVTRGEPGVVVAVVDTGVSMAHPDLAPRIWSNPGEVAGNGLDDDANGFVDDVRGWDFYDNDADASDTDGHGTHVAGTIAANGGDGYGVTGVAPRATIMPLRVLGPDGGTTTDVAAAFQYAAENGAKVVNASLGGGSPDHALTDAILAAPQTLFVVAAGNSATDNDTSPVYPCNITAPNLICVAATDQTDDRAWFSNIGRTSVHVAAPGTEIASTLPTAVAAATGSKSLADSPAAYANGTETWAALATPLDLSGKAGCAMSYKLRALLRTGDSISVERSLDGITWLGLERLTASISSFQLRSLSLAAFDGQPAVSLRFVLRSDASGTHDGVFIDDVAVNCSAGNVFSDGFESGTTSWLTGGTHDTWGTASVLGQWGFADGTSMATPHVAGVAALVWATDPGHSVAHVRNVLLGSVDHLESMKGVVATAGRVDARRAVDFAPDVTAPTSAAVGSLPLYQLARSFRVGWSATDTGPAGARKYFTVTQRTASYKAATLSARPWYVSTLGTAATYGGTPGTTYCFSVSAQDGALNASASSSSRCTVVPIDDRSLSTGSFVRKSLSSRYLGTYSYATARGAYLRLSGARYKKLALVATRCSTCGTIDVLAGSTLLRRISLWSSTTKVKQIIPVVSRTSISPSTTITLRVYTSGRPVIIEGLAISAV